MKKQETSAPVAIGGCSLLVIFGVLCLNVLALLSLNTAMAEKRMADSSIQSVTAWYEADLTAQRIFAELRIGKNLSHVTFHEGTHSFSVPISQSQTLEVELKQEADRWTVLRWQAVAHPEEINETLPVWQGMESGGSGYG